MQRVAIIGSGGFGRELLDVFEACRAQGQPWDVVGFIVEAAYGSPGTLVDGKPVLGDLRWLVEHRDEVLAICAIGSPQVRKRLVEAAASAGVRFCTVVHPSAILSAHVQLGVGVAINAGCIVTNNVRLGDHVQLHVATTVSHDTSVERLATLSPGARLSGNVTVGEGCYVGTGACVIEKLTLGEWSIVGAGATVVRQVPANSTVVGVPARVSSTRPAGWHLEAS